MADKLRIAQAVLVEGKYDQIRLASVLDALIIPVGGFRIYRDRELCALIKRLAESRGVVILTDSDSAGFRIRGYLKGLLPNDKVTQVYIPDLPGKERRKRSPSREGKLGVEGMDAAVLREAFARAGLTGEGPPAGEPVTRADLYEDGLSGGSESALLRGRLLRELGLPTRLSAKALLPVLGALLTREEYRALVQKIKAPRE